MLGGNVITKRLNLINCILYVAAKAKILNEPFGFNSDNFLASLLGPDITGRLPDQI